MAFCNNKSFENKYCLWKRSKGHIAMRIAGSGKSDGAICDCVVIDNHKVKFVEVKACKDEVFYVRADIKKQLSHLRAACLLYNLKAGLAIRFKNRGWVEVDISRDIPNKVKYTPPIV